MAVVLVSGGLDSTTCLGMAVSQGFRPVALTVDYGQRHEAELHAARRVAAHYGVLDHLLVRVNLFEQIGGSALTSDIEVPRGRSAAAMSAGIPVTYVPARNLVLLSLAVSVAEVKGAQDVFIGVNALDYSGYPDCRPEFISRFEEAAAVGTRTGTEGQAPVRILAPLIAWTKARIIEEGTRLGVPYELTHTCYSPAPDDTSCGTCDACLLRLKGFAEAGRPDPIAYVHQPS